jgi:hypothetical protein
MADVTNTYYAGDAFIGYGAEILVGQGGASPETFVAIPDVNSITMGDMTTGVVDITHLRSIGRHREKKGTIRDSGPIVIECNYRPTHGAHKIAGGDGFGATRSVVALWQNVTEANFRIVMPDDSSSGGSPDTGEVLDIRGVITRYQIGSLALEDKVGCTIEITPLSDYSDGLPA